MWLLYRAKRKRKMHQRSKFTIYKSSVFQHSPMLMRAGDWLKRWDREYNEMGFPASPWNPSGAAGKCYFFLFCSFFGKGRLEYLVCQYCCLTSDKLQKMVIWLTGTFIQRVAAIVASAKCPGILLAAFDFISKWGQTLKMHSKEGLKNFLLCSQPWSHLAITWDTTPNSTYLGKS